MDLSGDACDCKDAIKELKRKNNLLRRLLSDMVEGVEEVYEYDPDAISINLEESLKEVYKYENLIQRK